MWKKKSISFRCLLALLVLTFPLLARAAEPSPEDLLLFGDTTVSTPSRRSQPMTESPVPVTVLTRDDIRLSGARTIPEVLALAVGVNLARRSEAGTDVSVRGFDGSDKVLVMLDGRPLFNLADSTVDWRLIPVPVSAIERIEIVRGPGSALYGENAFFGAINIITVPGSSRPEASMWSSLSGSGGVTVVGPAGAIGRQELNRFHQTDAGIPNPFFNEGGSPAAAGAVINQGFIRLGSPTAGPALTGGFSQVDTTFRDFQTIDRLAFVAVDHRERAGGIDWQLGARALGQDRAMFEDVARSPYQRFLRLDADLRGVYASGVNNVVVAGVTGSARSIEDRLCLESVDDRTSDTVFSLFLEDQLALADKTVFLTAGGRVDVYADQPALLSPRLGIIYSPTPRHSFKAGWGLAARVPDYYDRYGRLTVDDFFLFAGNENLSPERISSYNLNYLYQNPGRSSLAVDLYYHELSDLIVYRLESYSPTGRVYQLQNEDRARAQGVEVEGRFRLDRRVELLGNYSYNDADYFRGGRELAAPFSPLHTANAAVFVSDGGANFSLWGHYVGSQTVVDRDSPFTERVGMNDYASLTARLEIFLSPEVSLAFYASDFLGGHYEAPTWAPVTPTYYIELRVGPEGSP